MSRKVGRVNRPFAAASPSRDVRGTFAILLTMTTDPTNEAIAGIMGWSPDKMKHDCAMYVDDAASVEALGRPVARRL